MSQTARRYRLLKGAMIEQQAQAWGNLGEPEMRTYRSTGRRSSPDSRTGYTHTTDQRLPLAVDPERTTWGDWLLRAVMVVPAVTYCAYVMGWLG